jgi:hypothetical protein
MDQTRFFKVFSLFLAAFAVSLVFISISDMASAHDAPQDDWLDEMRSCHNSMHGENDFEEHHRQMHGENWREHMDGCHNPSSGMRAMA